MAEKYYSILTNRGKELEAQSSATGKPVIIKDFVVGDGNGQAVKPDPAQTKLVREVYRNAISALQVSPDQTNQFIAQLVLPVSVGGFVVREVGLLTDAGELYSVANSAAIEKPENGVSVSLQYRLAVSETANIELKVATGDGLFLRIDKNLAEIAAKGEAAQKSSREAIGILDATTSRKGLVQLSSVTNSSSEALAATPKAVKAAYDLASGKYTAQDATTARKGIVQLSSATDSTSEALAATPKAVKTANDNAAAANKNASERVSKAGDSMTGTLNQDSVAQSTYNMTALSNAATGNKNYLRKMRGGGTDTIWHETVQGGEYRLATGTTDAQEELAISTSTGLRLRGNVTSQTGGFYSGNGKKFSFVSASTSDRNATLRLWGNVDRPTVVELGDDTGYHYYSQRNKDGSLLFQMNGVGQFSGYVRSTGEMQSSSANSYRIAYGDYGTFWRNDGYNLYLMLTNKGDAYGAYNAIRPLRVSLETGALQSETPLTVGNTIYASKEITAGYSGAYAWVEQYKTKAPFFNAYSTTGSSEYHPVIKQQATITGKNSWAFSMGSLVAGDALSWHLHMKGSGTQEINYKWDTNGNFSAPGQLIPGSFANFDGRYYTKTQSDAGYMPKTGAYTKAESDARFYTKAQTDAGYNAKNTASLSAAGGWHQDSTTGLIIQMGTVTRTGYGTAVNFPKAFPNFCMGVQLTLSDAGTGNLSDSSSNIRSLGHSKTGFTYGANGNPEKTALWVAFGK